MSPVCCFDRVHACDRQTDRHRTTVYTAEGKRHVAAATIKQDHGRVCRIDELRWSTVILKVLLLSVNDNYGAWIYKCAGVFDTNVGLWPLLQLSLTFRCLAMSFLRVSQ